MRNLKKCDRPEVLAQNAAKWTQEFVNDPNSNPKRFRYRDPQIKAALMRETGAKCIYCESKVGHNTHGDVEHKRPTTKNRELHFEWSNLTIACEICNGLKGAYDDSEQPFLDPYTDNVENLVRHHGPLVTWEPSSVRAEVTVRTLKLHDNSRPTLIAKKIEKLCELNDVLSRCAREKSEVLKLLLTRQIEEMQDRSAEYSAMVVAVCRAIA